MGQIKLKNHLTLLYGTVRAVVHMLLYIDTKAKCLYLNKLTWLCGRCLLEFIDWKRTYSQSCWYFRPSFVNCCPSSLSSNSTLPPPPCVSGRGGGWYGVLGLWQINTCRKVPWQVNILDILHCLLWVLSFHAVWYGLMFLLRDLIMDCTRTSFRYILNVCACLYVHLKGAAFFIYAADVDNIGVEGGLPVDH